ncbi:hypothetical protein [Oceanicoccus sp. KOV_DT_Chl]|uniref:hypothetical protein n=1 Tax=Oceanicoccus sp. KOV_DT_Chl TaxID=1904639 RepID=UPI000C7BC3EE|nr:hypothetical protein [Oceanicoccus sp. KOV_DT_Chl]
MKLFHLINYLSQQTADSFYISGRYGFIHAKLEHTGSEQPVYTVESSYNDYNHADSQLQIHQQQGFRLSTICCLCVGILFGERALNKGVIAAINRCFLP